MIQVENLHKRFGEVRAVDGVSFTARDGQVTALLGPNGAGKTTCIKILNTLLYPTSGEARVAGLDVVRDAQEIRHRIGLVSGGENSGYGILTVRECLWMFSQFYGVPDGVARERINRLLEAVDMTELAEARINRAGCFKYENVGGARSNALDGHVPEEVKEERWHRLMAQQRQTSKALLQEKVGRTIEVLVDSLDGGRAIGRSQWDAPEIDGTVVLEGAAGLAPGALVKAKVKRARAYDLVARVLPA